MIIVFEGPDFVGKSTQAKLLADKLPNAVYQKSPFRLNYDHGMSADLIYQWLNNGLALKYPSDFQKMFVENRKTWVDYELPRLKEQYKYIIIDRWNLSTLIYGVHSGISIDDVYNLLNKINCKIDLQFILSSTTRVKQNTDCFEESNFQKKIQISYDCYPYHFMRENDRIVSSDDTIESIHEYILSEVIDYEQTVEI